MFNCPNCLPVVSNDVDFLILFKNESAFTKRRKNELNNKKDTAKCNLFNIKLRLNANKKFPKNSDGNFI